MSSGACCPQSMPCTDSSTCLGVDRGPRAVDSSSSSRLMTRPYGMDLQYWSRAMRGSPTSHHGGPSTLDGSVETYRRLSGFYGLFTGMRLASSGGISREY